VGVDLIVVNYQTPGDLLACCRSYEDCDHGEDTKLWIVNNDPKPEDLAAAAEAQDFITKPVEHIAQENLFYSGAANRVGAMGTHDVLAIINADCRFEPYTVGILHDELMDRPGWGAIGPLQVGDHGEVTHGGIFGTLDRPEHREWRRPETDVVHDVCEAVTISGSAYFTKRRAWEEMADCEAYRSVHEEGPWLPTKHYYEETWYSYHLQAHGYAVIYYGKARMIHRWHKASKAGGWADRQMGPSRDMFRHMCDSHPWPTGGTIPHD